MKDKGIAKNMNMNESPNMVEVKVTVEVFDHYKGQRYKDDSRSFSVSQHCLADVIEANYDDNIENMKNWALGEAMKAVRNGYGR